MRALVIVFITSVVMFGGGWALSAAAHQDCRVWRTTEHPGYRGQVCIK